MRFSILIALATMTGTALVACGIQEHNVQPRGGGLPVADGGEPAPIATGGSPGTAGPGSGGTGGGAGGRGTGGRGGGGGSTPDAAPPAPTFPGIDVGGMRVPREKAVAIIHFGHSNMLGHGVEPAELGPLFFDTHPRLWSYRGSGRFVAASEPTATTRRTGEAGPGMAMLRAAMASAPEDIHFVSIGKGVGSATTQDWSKGGLYYDDFVAQVKELKGQVIFGAAVIMLGITDRHLPEAQQGGFADRLAKMVADLRADLGEPDLPVLHTDYEVESTGELALAGPVGQRFRPLIQMLPARIKTCALIPTDMTGMEDDHHFNLAGQKLFGERAIKILLDKKWARWPTK
jgi:hypothetical protein